MYKIKPLGSKINAERALGIPKIQAVPAQGLHLKNDNGDYKNDFYGLAPGEGVNIEEILRYLKTPNRPKLKYTNFIKKVVYREYEVIGQDGVIEVERTVNKTIPFTYTNKYNQTIVTSINCGINKRTDNIEDIPYPSLSIDYKSKTIICALSFFYVNTEKYRRNLTITSSPGDFLINNMYIGVKFFSDNIADMAHMVGYIQENDAEWYKQFVNKSFIPILERCDDVKELIWLYKNAPDFTLEGLKPEILWKHIRTFYNYDTKGTFSFLKDASPMFMKALFAFNTVDRITFLMKKINEDQSFIIKLYHALDDDIVYMGEKVPCKTALISAIAAFSTVSYESFNFVNEYFTVGKNYRVILEENTEESTDILPKYDITQKTKISTSFVPNIGTGAGGATYDIYREDYSSTLSPLDMVSVIQDDVKSLLCVPALFLYDEQYQKALEGTMTLVRLGIDMLVIAMAIETAGASLLASEASAGMTFFGVLAAVDGALALGDIGVQLNKDKLTKEFLEKWEKIYQYGGTATASPLVISNLYKLGGRILTSAAKVESKNFIKICLMKLLLESEISNFTKNTLRLANQENIRTVSGFVFDAKSFKPFWEFGCQLAYGEIRIGTNAVDHIALVYKGVPILEGTAQELHPELMALYAARTNKNTLEALLEKLYKLTPKLDQTKRFWTCFNEAGTELKWGKLSTAQVEKNIESAINNTKTSVQWEGEVAKAFSEIDIVKQIGTKVEYRNNGMAKFELAGDYDVLTEKYLIECKESVSKNIGKDFLDQFEKYLDPKNDKYINIGNKKVVLAIKSFKDNALNLSHPVLQQLKNKGVIIITNIKETKNLK